MIELKEMSLSDFSSYKGQALQDYSTNDKEGTWKDYNEAAQRFNEAFPNGLETHDLISFVIKISEKQLGFLICKSIHREGRKECFILDLSIHEEHRRNGYAKQAIDQLKTWANSHDYDLLSLSVMANNKVAKNLYASTGFDEVFTRMSHTLKS